MTIKFNKKKPIYIQIIQYIKQEVISKRIMAGEKLPSVRAMSIKLKVNANTLQRSYQELEREGVTYTQRGKGTFIKEDKKMIQKLKQNMAKESAISFLRDMETMGFSSEQILKIILQELKEGDK